MKQPFRFILVIGLLLILSLSLSSILAAQEGASENARVRIGYFAFDPRNHDTYIDGELAPFSAGWEKAGWAMSMQWPMFRTGFTTPYMDFESGVHSFAFVPSGEGIEAAILGPQEIDLKPGHAYSLAITGHMESGDLTLMAVDETEAFEGIDPQSNFMHMVFNNVEGIPPIEIVMDSNVVTDDLAYGQSLLNAGPYEAPTFVISTTGDEPVVLYDFQGDATSRISDLSVFDGSFPGEVGEDMYWDFNYGYAGDITIIDKGAVAVGDKVAGEVEATPQRTAYTLALDSDSVLNIFVNATGPRTEDSLGYGAMTNADLAVYVYDAEGNLLFWNDEITAEDDAEEMFDPGLQEIPLKAGVYSIQVGGYADLNAGPYELVVENAAAR